MSEDLSQKFNIVLSLGELGNIIQGLLSVAYGTAAPIIENLQKQVAEQVATAKLAEEDTKLAAKLAATKIAEETAIKAEEAALIALEVPEGNSLHPKLGE